MTKSEHAQGDTKMSVTPMPPERCGDVPPMVIERAEGGYAASCLRCGTTGPARGTSGEARRALLELGWRKRRRR
jgi:hypothetical protein